MFYHSFFLVMDVVVVFFFSAGRVQSFDENEIRLVNTLIISCTFTSLFFLIILCFLMRFANYFVVIAAVASQLHFAELRKNRNSFSLHYLWMLSSHFWSQNSMNGFRYILFFYVFLSKKVAKAKGTCFSDSKIVWVFTSLA